MDIEYSNKKVAEVCQNIAKAKQKYPLDVAKGIHKNILLLEAMADFTEVIQFKPFHFHGLKGDKKGQYVIDVKGRTSGYRMILIPLNDEMQEISITEVFSIAKKVKIILIKEVSKHYE